MRAVLRLLAVLVSVYVVTEVGAFAVYTLLRGEAFSFARIGDRRDLAEAEGGAAPGLDPKGVARGGWVPGATLVLHPYLGYVRRAGSGGDLDVTSLGFLEKPAPPAAGDGADPVVVAITGGSFAEQLYLSLPPTAFDFLSQTPRFRGRPVRVVSLAMRGYKQPQQLLAVAWLLSLGLRLDVVINVDGFNEIALADEIHRTHGVHPGYPYHWAPLTRTHYTPAFLSAVGEISVLRAQRAELARWSRALRFSVTAGAVWDALDRAWQRRIAAAGERVAAAEERGERLPAFRRGPEFGDGDLIAWAVGVWARSSRELADLARGEGFVYLHFLQPNQYLPGSKRLTPEEIEIATSVDRYGEVVRAGYPRLREAGRELAAAGVAFHDLTPIFADVEETIYVDRCCHVGERGNEIIAAEIVRALADHLAGADPGE